MDFRRNENSSPPGFLQPAEPHGVGGGFACSAIVGSGRPSSYSQQNSPIPSGSSSVADTQEHDLQSQQQEQELHEPPPNAYGVLSSGTVTRYITETITDIGRNSSTSSVHLCVGKNSFVSRKHFQILYDHTYGDFYLVCLSKNGIFINDALQRQTVDPVKLPRTCFFRFPSTDIRIEFESFASGSGSDESPGTFSYPSGNVVTESVGDGGGAAGPSTGINVRNVDDGSGHVIYSPLKITIPKQEQKSPFPSPTGTISAANSCPTSPRQGFADYHYGYHNNNNFQNDLFQPPSTTNYNEYEKPPFSYAQLIVQSISAAPDKQLTLSGIYSFISKNYPYYRKEANKGWQNSIRHNLSLNRYFIKVARSQDEPGKGSFWRIDPNSEAKLIDQSYKKRRQRGSQCFRQPFGMPRSAPVSPSHMDNSRENSPLRDVHLQSAPGSPGGEDLNYASGSSHTNSSSYQNNATSAIVHSGAGASGSGPAAASASTATSVNTSFALSQQQQIYHSTGGGPLSNASNNTSTHSATTTSSTAAAVPLTFIKAENGHQQMVTLATAAAAQAQYDQQQQQRQLLNSNFNRQSTNHSEKMANNSSSQPLPQQQFHQHRSLNSTATTAGKASSAAKSSTAVSKQQSRQNNNNSNSNNKASLEQQPEYLYVKQEEHQDFDDIIEDCSPMLEPSSNDPSMSPATSAINNSMMKSPNTDQATVVFAGGDPIAKRRKYSSEYN